MPAVSLGLGGRTLAGPKSKAVRLAGSYLITTCATMAAILLFVAVGSRVLPAAIAGVALPQSAGMLNVAFLLNVAIILFGWRRSKDLREALDSWEEAERAAHRNANIDYTTGLANRREFMRSLSELVDARKTGVLVLADLDHFKRVNDLHGHVAGDQLLLAVAQMLNSAAPQGSCCARLGGDEFAVLLASAGRPDAEKFAETLLAAIRSPVRIGNAQVHVTGSIGLAVLDRGLDQEAVLRRGDVALYAAKGAGRNCLAWFTQELEEELSRRVQLEEDIRRGIEQGEFVPYFQPLIDLNTRELVGFEALARWKSPTRGLIEPDSFIAAAEASGLIGPLTMSIMEQALQEARAWPAHLKIAVNISPVQFRDSTLAEAIVRVLTLTGFPARRLELEITEGALLEDPQQVTIIIQSLKALGISISLDDFGTGYASLAQLDLLPVDRIKIDRSFISTFVKSDRTAAIVNTIATMGHKLNVPITAEGVESEQVRGEVSNLGCSEAQGWLFGRAISAETVRTFLEMGGGSGAVEEGGAAPSHRADQPRVARKF